MRSTTVFVTLLLTFAVASPLPGVPLELPADVPPNHIVSDLYDGINPGLPGYAVAPFHRYNGTILDSEGTPFIIAGATWPGHITTIPEGLHEATIRDTIHRLRSLGLNTIRLTFSTKMVMEAHNSEDRTVGKALQESLGEKRVGPILWKIRANNPEVEGMPRLEVYDAIALEAARQGMGIILDNVNSQAGMGYEGWPAQPVRNATTEFDAGDWRYALETMATRAKKWPTFIGMSLRARLDTPIGTYDQKNAAWDSWYHHMREAARRVHAVNPTALLFMTGLDNGQDLERVVLHQYLQLQNGRKFTLDKEEYGKQVVLSMMKYPEDATAGCHSLGQDLYNKGFRAIGRGEFQAPVVLMGWSMGQPTDAAAKGEYAACIREFLKTYKGGWVYDNIAGSYYMDEANESESGVIDVENTEGLLTRDWTTWRNDWVMDSFFRPMVKETFDNAQSI